MIISNLCKLSIIKKKVKEITDGFIIRDRKCHRKKRF